MTVFLILAGQLAFSALSVDYLSRTHGLGRRIVLLHIVLVGLLFATIFLAFVRSRDMRVVRESRAARRLLLLIPGSVSMLLAFLYVVDYVSRFWGRNLNYAIVLEHVASLYRNGSGLVPIGGKVYAAFAVYLLLFVGIYQLAGNAWWSGVERVRFLTDAPRSHAGKWFFLSAAALALGWCGAFGYLAWAWNTPGSYLIPQYEPITSFLVSSFPDPPARSANSLVRTSTPVVPTSPSTGVQRRNVILIIIDCARADHLQLYGYSRPTSPFLKRLSEGGSLHKVDTALSTCSESLCGIRSIMEAVPYDDFRQDNVRLPDVLHAAGYSTYFLLSGVHNWYGLLGAYGGNHDLLFDGTSSSNHFVGDDRLLFEGLERVPDYAGKPSFFYFHLMSAHGAGVVHPAFHRYTPADLDWFKFVFGVPDPIPFGNSYDNGLLQADALIGELFDRLRAKGYLDGSIVLILGDHGQALGERPPDHHVGHNRALYQEYVHIPLLIYDEDVSSYRRGFATQIDVAPTIVHRLGLPVPPSWEGQSLLTSEPAVRYTFHQTTNPTPVRMVVRRSHESIYKYMRSATSEELYEVIGDPAERNNLVHQPAEALLNDLRSRLEARGRTSD
jgi:glucan phosphoethanolaminetransferase (alkaline phosphatase superfamily)